MERVWTTCNVGFSAFDAEVNGTVHRIDSMGKLRQVENDSFKHWKAGKEGDPAHKGARPTVFRQYSQNPGNRTDPVRIVPHPEKPLPRRARRGQRIVRAGWGDPS